MTPFRRLSAWYAQQSRVTSDLIIMGLVGLPIYLLAVWYNALDRFFEITSQHQNHVLDWLLILVICLGIAAKIFSVRRTIDLRREVALRRKAEAEAHRLARHDVLTGLPNRRWFIEDFDQWACHLPEGEGCALLVADLDNFKPVNDVYGHRLGDEVLRVVAKRLTRLVKGGSVSRLGGDEFGIILRYRLDSDAPERLARQIVHEVSKPIPLAALSLQVGVSIGVATCVHGGAGNDAMARRDGAPVETALRQADMAMYWAKAEGRGRYRFRSMDEKLQQRVELEAEIRGAIAAGQIVPYYQPLIDLDTSKTVGFEVLARWVHPKRGVLPPDVFIAIAEDTATVGQMTDHLLERAMRDAQAWPEHLFISINFAPRQISDPALAQRILGLVTKVSFPPHRLMIEITESAVVRRFELDTIKIDRSFVGQMLDKPEEARIVKAIVSLGHALGLTTTAEGIENKDALELLTKLGCDVGQGYLFGMPQPASVTTEFLREEASAAGKATDRPRRIA